MWWAEDTRKQVFRAWRKDRPARFGYGNSACKGDTVAPSYKKTLFRELFGTRRNGRMAPFLNAVLVAVAICSSAVVVALLVTALAGQIQH